MTIYQCLEGTERDISVVDLSATFL